MRPGWAAWAGGTAVGVAVVAGLLAGCGRQTSIVQADAARYPTAVHVYENGCITCHGDNLQGGIGPSLRHVGSQRSVAQMERLIDNGSGPMPAYRLPGDEILTAAQVQAVAEWLATKK
ncbi:MAG: cytochrome c [Alicyclobacillus sp.]|nr:cytochrome c [Alicyclobacillus sp.]